MTGTFYQKYWFTDLTRYDCKSKSAREAESNVRNLRTAGSLPIM
jgi:hypothetical protein